MIPENTPSEELNRTTTRRLRKALSFLSDDPNLTPRELWLKGKILQRLGRFKASLQTYLAHQLTEDNLDIVTGVITAALESGTPKTATRFSLIAMKNWPNDELIQSLAAMSFLIAGDLTKARKIAEICNDDIVLVKCDKIEIGKVQFPKNMLEIFEIKDF